MSKLFTEYKLGPITLKNRTIRSAAFENMCYGNKPSQDLFDYHLSVAKGGVGMTTIAYCAVDRSGVSFDGQLYIYDEIKEDLKKLTDALHAEGCKASIQLGHCGNMTHRATCKCMPVGPTFGFNLYSPTFYRKLKKEEIQNIVRKFGEAVDFCRECGFDCVEIHAGHAYLISQFLNPGLNRRKDEYGGSLENRMRFMNEVLAEVMKGRIGARLKEFWLGGQHSPKEYLQKQIEDALAAGSWIVGMTHGINYGYDCYEDASEFTDFLDYLKSLEDRIWIGTFRDVAAYTAVAKGTTLEVSKDGKEITIVPATNLDKALYETPLTLEVNTDCRKIKASQDGKPLEVTYSNGKVYVTFCPFGGAVTLK